MSGIGLVLNVAKDALLTQQYAIDVTSHNIANVDTDGYSRQSAVLEAKDAAPYGGFIFGRGVELNDIIRNTNDFLEKRLQSGQSELSSVSEQATYMSVLESTFDESSGQSLSTQLDDFWSAWNDLANNPSGSAERNALAESSTLLAESFNNINSDLSTLGNEINNSIKAGVDSINNILTQIADINQKIVAIEATGNANDLRDQRTQLVTELSGYIDINTYEYDDGNLVVSTGKGYPLVSRGDAYPLTYDGGQVKWESSGAAKLDITDSITGGKMGGWLEIRDNVIPEYTANLDELAKSLIWEVNKIHSQGVGLEGFTSVTGSYAATDRTAALNSTASGLDFSDKITDGSFKIWLYDSDGNVDGSRTIAVDASGSLDDLAQDIDNETGLNAMIKDGKLYIEIDDASSNAGDTFAFSDDTSNALAAMGVNTFFQSASSKDIAVNENILNNKSTIATAKINNNVGSAVGATSNTSTGIITTGGQYTGTANATYEIAIDSSDPTLFQWRKDSGAWTTGVPISSGLNAEGITVTFNGTYDVGDTFTIDVKESSATNGEFSLGDNTNTLNIADLQNQSLTIKQWSYSGDGAPTSDDITNTTIDGYLHTLVSSVGIKSQSVQREAQYKQTIQDQLTVTRDNISGVSLDEEMANLIKFQQAYTAAAKLITTAQDMLDSLLSTVR